MLQSQSGAVDVDEDALHTKVISATEAIKFERQVAPLEARKLG